MEPVIALATALEAELTTALGATVNRRYAPYFDADQLTDGKWVLLLATEETSEEARATTKAELAVDVAWQIAVPDPTTRDAEPIDTAWCDAQIEKLGALKNLFRPGGALREKLIAGADFRGYSQSPLYRPDLLIENGLFTAVVRLTFGTEYE